ncbi:quinol:cytochrome C oxidoreductase [Xanthovirga aplysinae]|uniref:quinol:cytochrome C oxidoreductase n=1 Tax=Xanthovirga aplysinae TaxID=2529853 RepID=UPI0012BD4789|nr:quinol:cytochrome C oxidoreductase [Xanthovirga aplysinae]MTI33282.1 quinol:cytochrome C oxidoreductase [Xanthovirga aplysinae]
MTEEKYIFTPKTKKNLVMLAVAGVIAVVLGIVLMQSGGHGHGDAHGAEAAAHGAEAAAHGSAVWLKRVMAGLWINNVFFIGVALIGLFFWSFNYAAQAGWSAPILRIPMAFSNWLPLGLILMLVVFFVGGHDIFHWTHEGLYDKASPEYDPIIDGKKEYLNTPFFLIRMVVYVVVWYLFAKKMQSLSLKEDLEGGHSYWHKIRVYAALFLVFFGITSSTSAWDWVMSIDTHWFSTLFGWYSMSSWLVSGVAMTILLVVYLKEKGYLPMVNSNHLHDLGKFLFGFSIFWAYLWVSQFLLYYYANIPEEVVYYWERWENGLYHGFWFLNIILNFVLPFLVLMTRDSKRHNIFLKMVCVIVLAGHWIDFYLGVEPGVMKENGGFGFYEIGITMIYLSAFLFIVLNSLSKIRLVPKNHPMLQESEHHHI